jgi:hypothetical protein
LKETRPLWPPQRGVGLQKPNLGKTNPRVSLAYSLAICFAPSLADSILFLTLTRLVVVFIFVNFSFALFTPPPSRRLSGCACGRGVTSVHAGEGSERPQESACLVLGPAQPTSSKKALVLPFIVIRRGSRCTMGGVAECYVSSGERASALGTCQCGSRRGLGTLLA